MDGTLTDASPVNPKGDRQAVRGPAGLVYSLVEGKDDAHFSSLENRIRDLLQIRISFHLPVILPAVFDFPHGMEEGPDDPPAVMVMDRAQIPTLPKVGQDDKGPIRAAVKSDFVIEYRRGWARQEGGIGHEFLQALHKPAGIPEKLPEKLLPAIQ